MLDIYTYNPTGEMAIANGMVSYMPPKNLRQFENDLAFLPSYFALDNDIVITPNLPDSNFVKQWRQLGLCNLDYYPSFNLPPKEYNSICPWSWNPAIHHKTKHLKSLCSDKFKASPNFEWKSGYKAFVSRDTTNEVQAIVQASASKNKVVSIPYAAINICSVDEFEVWIKNRDAAIIKMPWSSSGRGIHTIDYGKNRGINYPWLKGALKQQGFVTAEPLLNKQFDFSFQLNLKRNGDIDLLGYSYFINDDKGHFIGGNIHWPHQDEEISVFLDAETLKQTSDILINAIKRVKPHHFYEGPLGVDAIVFKDYAGKLKIHPCVDINWRYNMGMVNISLPKYVHPDSIGIWKVSSFSHKGWRSFIERSKKDKPLITCNSKIVSGFIELTPPSKTATFGAWMEVWPRE